jgi:hypothetical protein
MIDKLTIVELEYYERELLFVMIDILYITFFSPLSSIEIFVIADNKS